MRRVLIVSPHFCPVNAADLHRVRLALPTLPAHGWAPTVLALSPETIEGAVLDPLLEQSYPADVPIVRVRGIAPRLTRRFGFGSLWWRAGRALARAGDQLLASRSFDLVFFSTTQFDFLQLGPIWRRRHGVPYGIDYQDPWVNDYYARTGTPPPGGRLRFALAYRRARTLEPRVLRTAAGLVAVSPAYLHDLKRRYPSVDSLPQRVLAFGASERDLDQARMLRPAQPLVSRDHLFHLVSVGRAGPDLAPALRHLFRGVRQALTTSPELRRRLRLHFIGTTYAPPALARTSVLPLAREAGLDDLVAEHAARIPFHEGLHYLTLADGVLALGSDDPRYNPSKIVSCLLAARPVLAVLHAQSPAAGLAQAAGASVVTFGGPTGENDPAPAASIASWLTNPDARRHPHADALRDHLAPAMTAALAAEFDRWTAGSAPTAKS